MAKTIYTPFNYFDGINLTKKDALQCSHSGDCENDVNIVVAKPYVQRQLANIKLDAIQKELREYGIWDENELKDFGQNFVRLIWIAANNISENLN